MARNVNCVRPRVRVLVDVLLGWALDPALPDASRSHSSLNILINIIKYFIYNVYYIFSYVIDFKILDTRNYIFIYVYMFTCL